MNKILRMLPRIVLGLMMIGGGIAGLMGKAPPPETTMGQAFMAALVGSGLIYVIKAIEIVCGAMLMIGFRVPLALALLAPIAFNIAWFNAFIEPKNLVAGLVVAALWCISAYFVHGAFFQFAGRDDS